MAESETDRRSSASDRARQRAEMWDTAPAMVLLVLAQGSLVVADPQSRGSVWRVLWALSPLLPFAWLVWGRWRAVRRSDEYQRRVQLEAMAIGFGVVIALAMAGGVLDAAHIGNPRQSLQAVFILGVIAWIGASAVLTRAAR